MGLDLIDAEALAEPDPVRRAARAAEGAERAAAAIERIGGDPWLTAELARIQALRGDPAERQRSLERALELAIRAVGRESVLVAAIEENLGGHLIASGRAAESIPRLERALAGRERTRGPEHVDLMFPLGNLSLALAMVGRYGEAAEMAARRARLCLANLGEANPTTPTCFVYAAAFLRVAGRLDEADAVAARALALAEAVPLPVGAAREQQGWILLERGRFAEALQLFHRAEASGAGASARVGVALAQAGQGRFAQSKGPLEAALAAELLSHPLPRYLGDLRLALARGAWARRDRAGALRLADQARRSYEEVRDAPRLAALEGWLGSIGARVAATSKPRPSASIPFPHR